MEKCENCYHAKACGNYPNTGLPEKSRQRLLNKGCENFKDESLIVELPCRAGDVVWHYGKSFVIESIEIFSSRIVYRCGNPGTDDYMPFDNRAIGKTVFLSREEAERALEERETNADT